MKKLSKILLLSVLAVFLAAGSAMAIPSVAPPSGYYWTDVAYWTPTDLTTAADGSSFFQIQVENASYESDFGLFTVDDIANPTSVTTSFEIFDKSDEFFAQKTVYFQLAGGTWNVSLDTSSWTAFDNIFGFYYGVYTGGLNDPALDYTYYSDAQFNSVDVGSQHVAMAYDGISNVYICLDDQRDAIADWDFNDMTVFATDLAPVPEPATMLLLGTGLLGLAGATRRRFKK